MHYALNTADDVVDITYAMTVKPVIDTIAHLDADGRIKEVGSTYLNSCCATHQELDGILCC